MYVQLFSHDLASIVVFLPLSYPYIPVESPLTSYVWFDSFIYPIPLIYLYIVRPVHMLPCFCPFIIVLDGGTLWHLHSTLQCIKSIILELSPSTNLLYPSLPRFLE
jgi:hypothetical protein